jgi:hypothetical protein
MVCKCFYWVFVVSRTAIWVLISNHSERKRPCPTRIILASISLMTILKNLRSLTTLDYRAQPKMYALQTNGALVATKYLVRNMLTIS